MTLTTSVADKSRILKQYESYGYQVAFYLLQNEQLALQASVRAITELLKEEQLYKEPLALQRKAVKKVFIKHSLIVKKEWHTHGELPVEKTG